ncbi:threonine synthase [Chromatiales bacterium (ex Bugula neritina AB1)]|nr:threonine synthase [Chromatiales bacterium (ex Bugula neritina AB1)]
MKYISTRGGDESLTLAQILTRGTASNGGLFVPQNWPSVDASERANLLTGEYAEIAGRLLGLFGADSLPGFDVTSAIAKAMDNFTRPVGPPVNQLDDHLWTLELMHGPTLAFKDFALAPLAEIIDQTLATQGSQATVLCATSGDTGAATVSAFARRNRLRAVVLFPNGGVSDFQRRQMTTTGAANVLPVCVDGDFDDCQRIVKALYRTPSAERYGYTAVNSINMIRILLQTAYYFRSSGLIHSSTGNSANFIVPTGNFGNIYAAYIARQLGAPINRLTVTSNDNDVLPRFFDSGRMSGQTTVKTISPSMDIQVSSNFERLLWHIKGQNGAAVETAQLELENSSTYELTDPEMQLIREDFSALKCSEADANAAMLHTWKKYGKIICPHTATAMHAALQLESASETGNGATNETVIVETAHPAKFAKAVENAIGVDPEKPSNTEAMLQATEQLEYCEATADAVQSIIDSRFGPQVN